MIDFLTCLWHGYFGCFVCIPKEKKQKKKIEKKKKKEKGNEIRFEMTSIPLKHALLGISF